MPEAVAAPAPASTPAPDPSPIDNPELGGERDGGGTVDFDSDIDRELSEMDDDAPPPKKEVKKEVTPPAKPKKPAAAKKPEKKPEGEEEEEMPPGDEGKPKDKPETPPVKAADLRTAYEGLKKKVTEQYEPELSKLKAKLQKLESQKPEADAAITEELTNIKKERDALAERIRFIDYQAHPEFKEKYEKPYQDAWKRAISDLSEISIRDPETGTERTATAQDLMEICNMPLGEARRAARELFGDAADDIMTHRRVIRELSEAQNKALEDAKTNSGEHQKKLAAQRQIEHQETLKLWKSANESLAQKYPKWFAPDESDPEGNTLLESGFALADLHFIGPKDLTPEQIEMLPPMFRDPLKSEGTLKGPARVALDALIRNKVASHGRIIRKLKLANTRIKELEESLAQYEKSEPPAGRGGEGSSRTGAGDTMAEAEAELDALDTV